MKFYFVCVLNLLISTGLSAQVTKKKTVKAEDIVYVNEGSQAAVRKVKVDDVTDTRIIVGRESFALHSIQIPVKEVNGLKAGDKVYIKETGLKGIEFRTGPVVIDAVTDVGRIIIGNIGYEPKTIEKSLKSLTPEKIKTGVDVSDCNRELGDVIRCPEGDYKFIGNAKNINSSEVRSKDSLANDKKDLKTSIKTKFE